MVKRILVIEASGVHLAATCRVLGDFEEELGTPLPKFFDLFAGNGLGGVAALALANEQVNGVDLPAKLGNKAVLAHVMESSPWRRTRGIVQDTPLATGNNKRDFLKAFFETGQLRDVKKPAVVQAYDLSARNILTFSSKGDTSIFNPPVSDLADAISATPVYFPPAVLSGNFSGETAPSSKSQRSSPALIPHQFIDASLLTGSALLPAIAEARRLWPNEDRLVVVAVGPGRPARTVQVPPTGMGGPQWLQLRVAFPQSDEIRAGAPLFVVSNLAGLVGGWWLLSNCQCDLLGICTEPSLSDAQLRALLGEQVGMVRISGINSGVNDDIDDAAPANIDALEALGRSWYRDCRTSLAQLLTAPVVPLAPLLPAPQPPTSPLLMAPTASVGTTPSPTPSAPASTGGSMLFADARGTPGQLAVAGLIPMTNTPSLPVALGSYHGFAAQPSAVVPTTAVVTAGDSASKANSKAKSKEKVTAKSKGAKDGKAAKKGEADKGGKKGKKAAEAVEDDDDDDDDDDEESEDEDDDDEDEDEDEDDEDEEEAGASGAQANNCTVS